MPTTHLLYLHGFRSSPQSTKARAMQARVALEYPGVTWWCPQLPPSPRAAMALVMQGVAGWPKAAMAVVGSSLGGFYATWVAEQTGCARVVVLNPAVDPARDLARHIGQQTAWHDPGQQFYFQPEFIDELRALQCPQLTDPGRYHALITQGDEVLDWREMRGRYAPGHVTVLEGGDHAISNFDQHLDEVLVWLDLGPSLQG